MLSESIQDSEETQTSSRSSSVYLDAPEAPLSDAHDAASPRRVSSGSNPLVITSSSPMPATTPLLHASPVSEVPPTPAVNDHGLESSGAALASPDETTLTPLRAHYLKKSLVTLQFSKELLGFTEMDPAWPTLSPLSYLGRPFTPPPKGAPRLEVPFLKFMFRQFVLTFPFISSAPKDFFPLKAQPFVSSLVSRNLSTTDDVLGMDDPEIDPELRSRQKIIAKAEKYFSLILGSAVRMMEAEEVVRLSQRDLDRLETLARRRAARIHRVRMAFDVNIICVRTVVEKGRVRSRVHEEFIIRTRREGWHDVLVSRRYGDFKTLAEEVSILVRDPDVFHQFYLLYSYEKRIRIWKSRVHRQRTAQSSPWPRRRNNSPPLSPAHPTRQPQPLSPPKHKTAILLALTPPCRASMTSLLVLRHQASMPPLWPGKRTV